MSPGLFKGTQMLRIVIGNYHSDMKTIMTYYDKIKQTAYEEQEKWEKDENL